MRRDALPDFDRCPAHASAPASRPPERVSGPPHQVRSIDRHAWHVTRDAERAADRAYDERVVKRDRLEDRAQLVEAVRTTAYDAQVEVDLRVGAHDERPHCDPPAEG